MARELQAALGPFGTLEAILEQSTVDWKPNTVNDLGDFGSWNEYI